MRRQHRLGVPAQPERGVDVHGVRPPRPSAGGRAARGSRSSSTGTCAAAQLPHRRPPLVDRRGRRRATASDGAARRTARSPSALPRLAPGTRRASDRIVRLAPGKGRQEPRAAGDLAVRRRPPSTAAGLTARRAAPPPRCRRSRLRSRRGRSPRPACPRSPPGCSRRSPRGRGPAPAYSRRCAGMVTRPCLSGTSSCALAKKTRL